MKKSRLKTYDLLRHISACIRLGTKIRTLLQKEKTFSQHGDLVDEFILLHSDNPDIHIPLGNIWIIGSNISVTTLSNHLMIPLGDPNCFRVLTEFLLEENTKLVDSMRGALKKVNDDYKARSGIAS